MMHRKRLDFPDYVYPTDEWRMVETKYFPRFIPSTETLFATSNGYIGMRGSFIEGMPVNQPGTFINGFYESWPIAYAENAFGFARTGQTIVNVPDTAIIKLYVDDEPFTLETANLIRFERALNMKEGTLDREVLWETPAGKQVLIKSRRIVSFEHRHLAGISYEVTLLNADAPIFISSKMVNSQNAESGDNDPRKSRQFTHRVLEEKGIRQNGQRLVWGFQTANSRMTLACGIDHAIDTKSQYTFENQTNGDEGKIVYTINGKKGVPIKLNKFMAYHTSRRPVADELLDRAERTLGRAAAAGFPALLDSQIQQMTDFWADSDVQVRGDNAIQQAIRFNLFQIWQATARTEGAGVPAKGLTGQGYEGHYFWDAEIYVLPFLIHTNPRVARNLIKFRHSYLNKARERAKQVNQKGAIFPWRTINGEEASAYYAAGTAQYHINADIIYAMRKYVEVTGDESLMVDAGAEMLIESARLWRDLGFYSERKDGKFCILGVTGPDEYNTVVNNNTFTNLMARENLWCAASTLEKMKKESPDQFKVLSSETNLDPKEIQEWKKAADNMYVPYDNKLKIHPQDDDFLLKKDWDFKNTPVDHYPLLLHYHPLVIYRHKVIKQADVILALFLLGNEFSFDDKKRNFDYYDPLTTGDSSLSACIQSIVACEVGYMDKAREYARFAGLMDLADMAGNVKDGCHIASMGGFWMALIYGFAGMRDYNGNLSFAPKQMERIDGIRFHIQNKGQKLEVDVDMKKKTTTYSLVSGRGLTIQHDGKEVDIKPGVKAALPISSNGKKGKTLQSTGDKKR